MAVFNAFPMSNVAELIEHMGNARYIMMLNLTKGYWQIPIAKRDHVKTAFGMLWGLYEFIWVLFGLHGAPTTFQCLMNWILAPHTSYNTAYIDNIVVFTQTWAQHRRALEAILLEL